MPQPVLFSVPLLLEWVCMRFGKRRIRVCPQRLLKAIAPVRRGAIFEGPKSRAEEPFTVLVTAPAHAAAVGGVRERTLLARRVLAGPGLGRSRPQHATPSAPSGGLGGRRCRAGAPKAQMAASAKWAGAGSGGRNCGRSREPGEC